MKTLYTTYNNFAKRTAIILTLLLTLGITSAWGADETLTITYDSFKGHSTSYADQQWSAESSDGTSISGSATVCFTNNYDYIQLKNGHPAFRNTTALPGALKSITLTRQANGSNRQITMYVSTSVLTKDNYTSATSLGAQQVTSSGVTWTLTSAQQAAGYKYFYFHGSSNVCYLDNVVVTYAAASCANSVAVSAGTKTNVNSISFSSSSIATCSSTATDRQVTITVTPNTGYEMTSGARLTFTKTSGIATATYVSGPTVSGSSYQFVYRFNQNDNGAGTFSASCTPKKTIVSFNQNGGEGGQTASVTATYGQNMPTPITLPTRYGHTFGGYYEGEGGTGTQYYTAEGASAKTWNKTSASATLYAKWIEKDLTNYRTTCSNKPSRYLTPKYRGDSGGT